MSLLIVEGKMLSYLSDSLKLLKVEDKKITLSFFCLLVINYCAFQKGRKKKLSKTKILTLVESTS